MKCRGIVTVKKTGAMCDQLLILEIGGPFRVCLLTKYWLKSFVSPLHGISQRLQKAPYNAECKQSSKRIKPAIVVVGQILAEQLF